MTKHSTFLELPVEVIYEILPGMTRDGEPWLPEQVDIKKVMLKRKKRGRKIDLLPLLEESTVLNIEDEISETLNP